MQAWTLRGERGRTRGTHKKSLTKKPLLAVLATDGALTSARSVVANFITLVLPFLCAFEWVSWVSCHVMSLLFEFRR
jgi:hypothetical protein